VPVLFSVPVIVKAPVGWVTVPWLLNVPASVPPVTVKEPVLVREPPPASVPVLQVPVPLTVAVAPLATVSVPARFRLVKDVVPPFTLKPAPDARSSCWREELAATLNVPAVTDRSSPVPVNVRLLTLRLAATVTVMLLNAMTASSLGPGTTPPCQFVPVLKSPPTAAAHWMVDGSSRFSSGSTVGRKTGRRQLLLRFGALRGRRTLRPHQDQSRRNDMVAPLRCFAGRRPGTMSGGEPLRNTCRG
jgi:hypothetical protein